MIRFGILVHVSLILLIKSSIRLNKRSMDHKHSHEKINKHICTWYKVWLKLVRWFFKPILSMYFCNFIIISPWKRIWPFICSNLNPLQPRGLCAKFDSNWPSGSKLRRDFLILSMNFCLNTLFQRRLYTKFGWYWINGSWEEDFQILSIYFCYLVIISTWKWAWPFILINLNPLQPRILCFKVWLKLARWFLRRRWKCEKFTDRQTTGDQKSSLELSAQVS